MTFENLFEDLEALFESQLSASKIEAGFAAKNLALVDQRSGIKASILAPIMGSDFIAGVPMGEEIWKVIPFSALNRISFIDAGAANLPAVKETGLTIAECLARLPLPIYLYWRQLNSEQLREGQLVEVYETLLSIQVLGAPEPSFYPITIFADLSISAVENLGELG